MVANPSNASPPIEGERDFYVPALFPQPGSVGLNSSPAESDNWDTGPSPEPTTSPSRDQSGSSAAGANEQSTFIRTPSGRHVLPPSSGQSGSKAIRDFRQVARLIDEELLKRTQWRQEQQKLKYSQEWLWKSTKALKNGLRSRSAAETGGATTTRRNIKSRGRGALLEGIDPSLDIKHFSSATASISGNSSRERTDSEEKSLESNIDSGTTTNEDIATLYDTYEKDYIATQEQERIVTSMADELGNLSFRLQSKLENLRGLMKVGIFTDQMELVAQDDSRSLSDTRSPTWSEHATPQMVTEYFDKVGDVGIYEERLVELIDTHEEGIIEREFRRDRGDVLKVTDEEFMQIYHERRAQIEQDLREAKEQVETLRRKCEEAGLDINAHRRRHSVYSSSPPTSSQSGWDDPDAAPKVREYRPAPGPGQMEPKNNTRVGAWVQKVSADVTASPMMAPLESDFIYPDDAPRIDEETPGYDQVQPSEPGFEFVENVENMENPFILLESPENISLLRGQQQDQQQGEGWAVGKDGGGEGGEVGQVNQRAATPVEYREYQRWQQVS